MNQSLRYSNLTEAPFYLTTDNDSELITGDKPFSNILPLFSKLRIAGSKANNGITSCHARCQTRAIETYFPVH